MKTDVELLAAATEAVNGGCCHPLTHNPPHGGSWNPLTDDGDALRLAVTLKIQITIDSMYVFGSNDPSGDSGFCECINGDAQAATRRAIVRAAAARSPAQTGCAA